MDPRTYKILFVLTVVGPIGFGVAYAVAPTERAHVAFEHQVSGTLVDAETGAPIIYSEIVVSQVNLDPLFCGDSICFRVPGPIRRDTDSNGRFRLPVRANGKLYKYNAWFGWPPHVPAEPEPVVGVVLNVWPPDGKTTEVTVYLSPKENRRSAMGKGHCSLGKVRLSSDSWR